MRRRLLLALLLALLLILAVPRPCPDVVEVQTVVSGDLRTTTVSPAWGRHPEGMSSAAVEMECQLRRGGGMGVVAYQHLTLAWGRTAQVDWVTDWEEPGWYEVFCRLPAGSGAMDWLLDDEGQDGHRWSFIERFEIVRLEPAVYLPAVQKASR